MQMVDRYEREPPAPGEPLGGREPDEQRADEPRPLRDCDPVDLVQRGAGERLADDRRDELEVPA